MTAMKKKSVAQLIRETGGRFFRVSFVKRTNGERREMLCRIGVTKHLRGGDRAYEPSEHNLATVFDVQKKAYRSIPLDGLISFRCGKVAWRRA